MIWEKYPNKDRFTPAIRGGDGKGGGGGNKTTTGKSYLDLANEALKNGDAKASMYYKTLHYQNPGAKAKTQPS